MTIKRTQLPDFDTSRFQDDAVNSIKDITAKEILQGAFYKETIKSTGTRIYHGLERVPNGYIIADKQSASNVYRTNLNKDYIDFVSTSDVDVKIYIF